MVVLLFCGALFYGTKKLQARDEQYAAREKKLEEQIEEAKEEAEELGEMEIYVQTREYIEKLAREKLGLVMPGETVLKPNEDE